jgi:hypothetical protein
MVKFTFALVLPFINDIHSCISLSYDRSKAFFKASSPHSAIYSFKWEYPLLSLKSSSNFLHLLPRLFVTFILPFVFPSITRCRRQFLRKLWPTQLAFRLLISYRIFLCSFPLITLLHFPHDRSNWSPPSFFSTRFKKFTLRNYRSMLLNIPEEHRYQEQLVLYTVTTDSKYFASNPSNVLRESVFYFPSYSHLRMLGPILTPDIKV